MCLWCLRHTLLALPELALDSLTDDWKGGACHADIGSFVLPGL